MFCEEVFPLNRATPLHDSVGEPIVHGLRTGAFAGHMVVDQSQAIAIPKDMALDSASLIACGVLTGMGAVVDTAGVKPGSSVVVIGCGGVGLDSIQGARMRQALPRSSPLMSRPPNSSPRANSAPPKPSTREAKMSLSA